MAKMEDIVSLCKRRGFIFPGSDVYGGMAGTWDFGPLGMPPILWAPGGPPPLMPAPTHSIFLPKNPHLAQARVLAHFAAIFDLLAQSTSHKTAWGDCSLVCDSSIGPISFCSSALFIANLCCLGDHVLELACQIYMVPSSSNA